MAPVTSPTSNERKGLAAVASLPDELHSGIGVVETFKACCTNMEQHLSLTTQARVVAEQRQRNIRRSSFLMGFLRLSSRHIAFSSICMYTSGIPTVQQQASIHKKINTHRPRSHLPCPVWSMPQSFEQHCPPTELQPSRSSLVFLSPEILRHASSW